MISNRRPDFLAMARHEHGDVIWLHFADGLEGTVNFSDIGLDTSRLNVATVRAASDGTSAELDGQGNETFQIDSSVLRALVDSDYANAPSNSLEPQPNVPMLKALAQIYVIQQGMNLKSGKTSVELVREVREDGRYGVANDN
jgi:hypothetical protein